jgi:hypothetical protein
MTDTPEIQAPEPVTPVQPQSDSDERATPEERLAETQADDPDVGLDGTGLGELP